MRATGSPAVRRRAKARTLSAASELTSSPSRNSKSFGVHPRACATISRASSAAVGLVAARAAAISRRSEATVTAMAANSRTLRRQQARLMIGDQRVDQFVERIAGEHLVELVE